MNFKSVLTYGVPTTLFKILSLFITNKAIALFLGPAGYAGLGHFQNLLAIASAISGGIFTTGVTQEIARRENNEDKTEIWQTAFVLSLLLILISFPILVASSYFFKSSNYFENNLIYGFIIICLPALIISNIGSSLLNGVGNLKDFSRITIYSSLATVIFLPISSIYFGEMGAITAVVISQILTACFYLRVLFKINIIDSSAFIGIRGNVILKRLINYCMMSVISCFAQPLTYIFIRNTITDVLGIEAAGNWQGLTRMSEAILVIFMTPLSYYFIPKFAQIKTINDMMYDLRLLFGVILPTCATAALTLVLFKHEVVLLLFSDKFELIEPLIKWQLIGDLTKVCTWILGYLLMGRLMVGYYMFAELIFWIVLPLSTFWLLKSPELENVSIAYALSYFFYFILIMAGVVIEISRMRRIECR
jgi:PST family polysaccharide transporter